MPSSQQTAHSAFESGGQSAPAPPSEFEAVARPTLAGSDSALTAPRPKYETPPDELEPQNPQVTDAPEGVLPLKRYVPGSAAGSPAPLGRELRFTKAGR